MGGSGASKYEARIARIDAIEAAQTARIEKRKRSDTPKKGKSNIPSPQGSPMRIME